jgi:predicted metalloprotease
MIKNSSELPMPSFVPVVLRGFGRAAGTIGVGLIVLGWLGNEIQAGGEQQEQRPARPADSDRRPAAPDDGVGRFVTTAVGNINAEWTEIFQQDKRTYRKPVAVLYRDRTDATCGGRAQSVTGPFYCPADDKVYLNTSFFQDMETRRQGCEGAPCRFSQAYVIAHQIGHHVQNLLGILPKVRQTQQGMDAAGASRLQARMELQADCLVGLWAHHQNGRLEKQGKPPLVTPGDVEAALQTAPALGNDHLQTRETERSGPDSAAPDALAHGTPEQRLRWLQTGLKEGTVASCNTFRAGAP